MDVGYGEDYCLGVAMGDLWRTRTPLRWAVRSFEGRDALMRFSCFIHSENFSFLGIIT